MPDWAVALLSVGGSAIFSLLGSFVGSYVASKHATHRAEQEERGER